MNFRTLQTIATASCAIAAVYLLSILLTGGYAVNIAGVAFEANKLWPAIVATLGFAILRAVFLHGSIESALKSSPGLIIFSIALIVFLANGRTISGGDSVPAKNLPLSILEHGNFYLDQLVTPGQKKIPYYLRESGGHYVSDYPVGAALMALPFYVPSIVCGVKPTSRIFSELEKISAATIVALSVLVLYMAAARATANWMAMLIALIYAFGTTSLSVSSQALWQHGPAQLALAAAIYCFVRARDEPRWAGYAGLPLSFEVMTRPADALIAAPLGLYVLVSYRREIWTFAASAIVPILFQLWYSATYFGSPFRVQFFSQPNAAYGQPAAVSGFWATPLFQGLSFVVLSPGRGLLFYSPIFILSFIGLAIAWQKSGDVLLRYMGVGVILSITLAARWHKPSGGESFGPRLLSDLTPIMAFALIPLADAIRNRRAMAIAFMALGAWSIAANASGAFISYRTWNNWALNEPDTRLWLWSDNPVVDPMRSTFDAIRIAIRHGATSKNSPDKLDARLAVLNPNQLEVAAGARVHVSIRATNTGMAVWLGGHSADDRGVVSLGCEWKRDGTAIDESIIRHELHLNVFPGNSMELEASALAPETAGTYQFEISLAVQTGGQTARTIGERLTIPVVVTPIQPAAAAP